jgi:peptidoglycan/xylan/chitin deacetylase (PgdA/CDA1 family)
MRARGLLLLGGAGWIGYALVPHLVPGLCIRRGPAEGRRVALTFDDGPDPEVTPRVLDVLAAHGVRASFFCVGRRAAAARDVIRRMADEGHDVLSHGWSHASLWRCSPARTDAEVGRAHGLLTTLSGRAPAFFRPPWGMLNAALPGVLQRHGARAVLWSLQTEGLRPVHPEAQVARVAARIHPGAIVDLHDAEGTAGAPTRLLAALPGIIAAVRRADYVPVPLTTLLAPTAPAA